MSAGKEVAISLLIGAGAGAAVGFGIWWFASKKLDEGFDAGVAQMANQLGMGSIELRQQLTEGTVQLREELARQVEAQVRPAVATEVRSTLARYNITADTGRRIDLALSAAERLGLI